MTVDPRSYGNDFVKDTASHTEKPGAVIYKISLLECNGKSDARVTGQHHRLIIRQTMAALHFRMWNVIM